MRAVELVLILLAVAAALHLLAARFGIPHPALLVLGGLLLAVTPGLPVVELQTKPISPGLFGVNSTTTCDDALLTPRQSLPLPVAPPVSACARMYRINCQR